MNMNKSQRVALYIRVSTKLQEDRYSLKAQQTELTDYANRMGWTIVGTFQDVDSGSKLNKQGLNALLDYVEDGKIDIVLVIEQDRLSRLDMMEWAFLKGVLRENKVKIAEPGNVVDLSNMDEEFLSDLKNLYAGFQRRKIKKATGRGMRQYAREGKVMGRIPDEYVYDRNTRKPIINEERAWVIKFIDRLFLDEKMSKSAIAKELSKLIKTKNGTDFTDVQIDKKLRSKAYHGVLERRYADFEPICVEGVFPVLRSLETFEKIQLRLEQTSMRMVSTGKFKHPLKRLKLVCSHCGRILGLSKNVNASGRSYITISHKKKHAKPCLIDPSFNANLLVRPMYELIYSLMLDKDNLTRFMQHGERSANDIELLQKESELLRNQVALNEERIDRLLELYLNGTWDEKKLNDKKAAIESENSELLEKAKVVDQKVDLIKRERYNLESYFSVIDSMELYMEYFEVMRYFDNEIKAVSPIPRNLTLKDQEDVFSGYFDEVHIDWENRTAKVYGKKVEGVPFIFDVMLDETNLIDEHINKLSRYEKYVRAADYSSEQSSPVWFMDVARAAGIKPETLNAYINEFGPIPNIAPKQGSPEREKWLLGEIKNLLRDNPRLTGKQIGKKLNASNTTVLRLIKEHNLR